MARPCGEQLDKYGECIDLTGKISTPSLLRNLFLTPVPDPLSDRGKSDYIGRTSPAQMRHRPVPLHIFRSTLQLRFDLIRFLLSIQLIQWIQLTRLIPCSAQEGRLAPCLAVLTAASSTGQ